MKQINPKQSAYRSSFSKETAPLSVHDYACTALDHQKAAVFIVLLDLSAAFYTLDRNNSDAYRFSDDFGITGSALSWFQSYFQQRKYHVRINNINSEVEDLNFGVPQGSVIGTQCFTMYIRPSQDIFNNHGFQYHIYADDIQIYSKFDPSRPHDGEETLNKLSQCMKDIKNWMVMNKLKLNQEKTEFMIIASQAHLRSLQH